MLKGIPIKNVYSTEISPFTASESVIIKSLSLQDTTKTQQQKALQTQYELKKPEVNVSDSGAVHFKTLNQKYTNPAFTTNQSIVKINPEDTSSIRIYNEPLPFQLKRTEVDELYSNNFLLAIPHKNISQHFDTILLTQHGLTQSVKPKQNQNKTNATIIHKETGFQGNLRNEASLDWLPAILLISLFTFSWIKLVYQKYVAQVIASLVNYQASIRLLRERNVLFRNMALGLNFIFSVNIGLFIFFYLQYHNLNEIVSNNFISVLVYSVSIILLYNIKTFICKLIGNVFMVKEEFAEYVHNIHLYNKNIGLFLFPIVILFPYITNDQIKPIVLYLGLSIIIGMFLLLIYRGFQIIMRNGVSSFYLILYLCAVEILPILLLVKYSYTLI